MTEEEEDQENCKPESDNKVFNSGYADSIMTLSGAELTELERISPVKGILRRSSSKGENDIEVRKPEVEPTHGTGVIDGKGARIKTQVKKKKLAAKKVKLQVPKDPEDESDPEMYHRLRGERRAVNNGQWQCKQAG